MKPSHLFASAALLALASFLSAAETPTTQPTAVPPAPDAPGKIKLLIVTGGHPYQHDPFFKFFQNMPDINYTSAVEGDFKKGTASAYDNTNILTYDVVLLYDFQLNITSAEQKNFLALFDKGVGLIVLHHALLSYQGWPEYERIAGGLYLLDYKKYGDKIVPESTYTRAPVDIHAIIADKSHPITAGLSDFDLKDELYRGVHTTDDIHPLLTIEGKPAAWTRTEKNSRIFTIILGHGPGSYDNPNFQKIMSNALHWTAKQ